MTLSRILQLSPAIRYAATYRTGELCTLQRPDVADPSESESDRFEELLVNPTLMKLVGQRGDIDCGGAQFVVVGYGKFLQLVIDLPDGHVSVAFDSSENPIPYVRPILSLLS